MATDTQVETVLDDLQEISDRFIAEMDTMKKSDMLDYFAFDVDLSQTARDLASAAVEDIYHRTHHEDAVRGHFLSQELHRVKVRFARDNA